MKLSIIHDTEYTFSKPIFLEPHTLRFRPKVTPHQSIDQFKMSIHPEPSGLKVVHDVESNIVDFCWFEGLHDHLSIHVDMVVDNKEFNPFNFIFYPLECAHLPFTYPFEIQDTIRPFLQFLPISDSLFEFGKEIQRADSSTMTFLNNITNQIHSDFIVEFRLEGEPYDPSHTFSIKKGSCRDLSWMLIHLLRNMGIAARFVSGYYFIDVQNPQYELHGWVEVYLPGAGWVGLDPTNGLMTGHHHISLCTSSDFKNTMPVTGTFRGDADTSMTSTLSMKVMEK